MKHVTAWSVDAFPAVLERLPPGLDLDEVARRSGAIQRRRQVDGGATLLQLSLARGPGGMSLRATAAWASTCGLAEISNPSLKARLDGAGPFLEAIMMELLAARRDGAGPTPWPGRCIRLADGTCLAEPGSAGVDWRVHAVLDLGTGGFSHLGLTDARGAEALDRGAPLPGEVRIADRGFGRGSGMVGFHAAAEGGADLIVRIRPGGVRLRTPEGARFDLHRHLAALPAGEAPHEVHVRAVAPGGAEVPLRLVIARKPAEATAASERQVRRNAGRRGQELQPATVEAAGFLVLATTLPAEGYPAAEVLAAYRLRWQIELAFKRLKSLLHLDRLPTHTPQASRSWIAAHLVLAVLTDAMTEQVMAAFP